MKFSKIAVCTLPKDSLLALHSQRHAHSIHDCFVLRVTASSILPPKCLSAHNWATCFFQSQAFQLESLLLRSIRWWINFKYQPFKSPPLSEEVQASFGSGFFRVLEINQADEVSPRNEILLDSGPFLTWLAITPAHQDNRETILYHFGTLTKEPNAFIRFVYPLHIWYSKLLLASGARQHLHSNFRTSSSATK